MKQHRFIREGACWYIDVPEFVKEGGCKADLEIAGATIILDIIAGDGNEVTLEIDTIPFDNADELILIELNHPVLGDGYYHIKQFENKEINNDLWLGDVTRFAFGDIPEKIYVKRIP